IALDRRAHLQLQRASILHARRHPATGVWRALSGVDPGLYLDFSWAFVLRDLGESTTRRLLRTRAAIMDGSMPAPAWMRVMLPLADFADFIYTRQMLRGIRWRVERACRSGAC